MFRGILAATIVGAVATVFVPAAVAQQAAPNVPLKPRTVQLTRMIVKMPVGAQWYIQQKGIFCTTAMSQTWSGAESNFNVSTVMDTFRNEMTKAGLAPEQEPSLFEPNAASPSEFALAGIITDEYIKFCSPDASVQGLNNVKGDVSLTIEWQLYSRVEKQVVATAHTSGAFSAHETMPGGLAKMINLAFAENVRRLAADPAIRQALAGRALGENELVKPPAQPPIVVPNVRLNRAVPPAEAGAAVVVIYAGNVLGSGFLISRDGYLLTDAHVVGDAERVRVRWLDGKEGVADVVRRSKERDVALLKTDAGLRAPLALGDTTPEVGATVFAVGAPEGQKFEGTVTKGVVSASRIFQGFTYIQSDVTTGQGASGGPLVDQYGRVVGLRESGTHAATSSGISLFTPIKDAIAFLGLDLR